jgi:hypothetical protein
MRNDFFVCGCVLCFEIRVPFAAFCALPDVVLHTAPTGRSTPSGDEYVPSASATRTTHRKHATGAVNSAACAPDQDQRKKRRKSGDVVRAFACQLCTKRYGTRAALSLHFKLKHELPLRTSRVVCPVGSSTLFAVPHRFPPRFRLAALTSWNELQAARDVELAYGPMINDTVGASAGLFSGFFFINATNFFFSSFFRISIFKIRLCILYLCAEAFVADKHGEMSQRAVVRTAALACILGRTAPSAGASSSGSGGGNHAAAAGGGDAEPADVDVPTAAAAAAPTAHARKRVRLVEPEQAAARHDTQTQLLPVHIAAPVVVQHQLAIGNKCSLPSLAAVLSADVPQPTAPIVAASRMSPPRAALPPLHSLVVPAKSSGATSTFLVDVEFFKLPPLVSPHSTGEPNSPNNGRRDSVAGEEETALLLVTLGAAQNTKVSQTLPQRSAMKKKVTN